jgi:hypothetical protein
VHTTLHFPPVTHHSSRVVHPDRFSPSTIWSVWRKGPRTELCSQRRVAGRSSQVHLEHLSALGLASCVDPLANSQVLSKQEVVNPSASSATHQARYMR